MVSPYCTAVQSMASRFHGLEMICGTVRLPYSFDKNRTPNRLRLSRASRMCARLIVNR